MMRRSLVRPWQLLLAGVASLAVSCRSTMDYLGYDRTDGLAPIACPASYRGAYLETLGRTQGEVDAKLASAFEQLFYGTADNEAIYFEMGSRQAFIRDVLHNNEVRTEGMALGMLICAMLNKRAEFDRLWRYVAANLPYPSGPLKGYFRSRCDLVPIAAFGTVSDSRECADPYGLQQLTMALLLARQRWPMSPDSPDYGTEAKKLLDLMRGRDANGSTGADGSAEGGAVGATSGGTSGNASAPGAAGVGALGVSGSAGLASPGAASNGGAVGDASVTVVPTTFDSVTQLVFEEPAVTPMRQTGTALEIPAYYAVWAQVTGDPTFADAANAARRFLVDVAHPQTGLVPVRATFTAVPVPGWGDFSAEAYRALLNLVIDRIWGNSEPWQTPQIDRALAFFSSEGQTTYGAAYSLDGNTKLTPEHYPELVYVNGAIAALSTNADRKAYLQAAWNEPVPTGVTRYYRGVLYLVSNMILGGRFQLCP